MTMQQNYGVLRVVRVRLPANATANLQERYPSGWLPEERLVHLLTQRETTIGRALNNDIILMDPTISREHARLVLDDAGWHITNLTAHNVVRVNGAVVPYEASYPLQPQDILILGSTMLQLIAPQQSSAKEHPETEPELENVTEPSRAVKWASKSPPHSAEKVSASQNSLLSITPPASLVQKQDAQSAAQKHISAPLDAEPAAQDWDEEESLLGAGITMQFALPQRMGGRTRWLIVGGGVAILVLSAVITVVLNGLVGLSALAQYGPLDLLAAIIIPTIPALGINLLVNFMDRFEREPWFLRLAAFLWGAIIAIPIAFFVERKLDTTLLNLLGPNASDVLRSVFQGLNAGITEETIKGAGLLLLFFILRDEFDNVTDGIVYGALIGAGFAMVENFRYFANDFQQFPVFLIVYRIVLGWLGHSTFTVCFGAALGYIRHTRIRWRQMVIPLLGFLLAVGLHSFFDFVDFQASAALNASPGDSNVTFLSLLALIGDYIPPFLAQIFLLYILIKSLAHEAAVIREFLAVEVSNGVVKVDEYALLQNSFHRTKAERRVRHQQGWRQWMRVKALYQTEIGLAFRKWHVSMGDKPKLGYLQPEDAYRQRIKRLRYEIAANEPISQGH
ncbi:MAG TPA: PrsW family glutamic-type intramembrane protease [Ktedonobacteraceae bacterium]|nr:PrsW family glutamic-type intramembrane protease [Ktedonobacteraceae bacterium]